MYLCQTQATSGAMINGTLSSDPCGCLYQLQVRQLLQHKDLGVCSEGLNGEMEASQHTFQKHSLWDASTPGEAYWLPSLLRLDPSSRQPLVLATTVQMATPTQVPPPPSEDTTGFFRDVMMGLSLQLPSALKQLPQISSTASASQVSTLKKQLPPVALGPPSPRGYLQGWRNYLS